VVSPCRFASWPDSPFSIFRSRFATWFADRQRVTSHEIDAVFQRSQTSASSRRLHVEALIICLVVEGIDNSTTAGQRRL
jgi:hypothetical protein